MAAPLSGIGQQQQVPLSQPFQPGGTDQTREIRQRNQEPRDGELQVREAPAARSQETDQTQSSFQDNLNDISVSSNNSEAGSAQGRGSVVDITV